MHDQFIWLTRKESSAFGVATFAPSRTKWFFWLARSLKLAFLFCLLAVSHNASAMETSKYAVRNWLREDGLPQSSVTAVAQTRDGYIWVATYSGLARFDGVRFTVFDKNTNPELRDSQITSLFEGPDGTLWIGHADGTVTSYREGHFANEDYHAARPRGKICGMGTDAEGDVWLFDEAGSLARIRDGRILSPPHGELNKVMGFACSPAGVIWVERDGLVSELEHGQLHTPIFDQGRSNLLVEGMCLSRDGGLWVACDGRYQKWKDDRWVGSPVESPWGGDPLMSLMETQAGLLVAATSDRGLFVITSDGSGQPSQFCRTNGFPADWIVSLMEDREGDLWAATGGAGLVRLRQTFIERATPPDQWQGRPIKAVTMGGDGAVWVGTEGAGVYELQAGAWKHYSVLEGLTNYYVWSLAEDPRDDLWAGTWSGGLYKKHGETFHLAPGFEPQASPITGLLCEGPGQLWLGTGDGLVRYDDGRRTLYAQEHAVRTVLKDRSGTIWFGTSGGGLGCWQQGVVHHFGIAEGLRSDFIQCLHEDDSGAVWIGTSGGGLSRFKAGKLATIDARQGLADNDICDIEDDGLGYYWMSSFNGLLRVRKTSLDQCADGLINAIHCDSFGISDGMPTLECSGGSQPSGCVSGDGLLWFATSQGLVTVHPDEVKHNLLPPPVMIEQLVVDGVPVTNKLNSRSPQRIPPGRHRLEFQFTGLSFKAPEKVSFKYRLDKLDADWITVGTQRRANYDYIPPGDYHFHVIACNNDGVWSDPGASVAVTILPYFWQTGWFRLFVWVMLVGLVGGLIWLDARRRMRRKLERLERQQAVAAERARIANDIHDDLGQCLTRITMLSQPAVVATADAAKTRAGLREIYDTAREITRAMDEIVWAVNPRHDTVESLVNYLEKCALDFLGSAGLRCRLEIPDNLPDRSLNSEVRHNLFLALKEALNNVVKHAHATEVRVGITMYDSVIELVVKDDGCGFGAGSSDRVAAGNGLHNMRQRLEKIGGQCEIAAEPGRGTTVHFKVSLGSPSS